MVCVLQTLALTAMSQAVLITVEIDGVVCQQCSGNDTVWIPDGTYNGVTIYGLSAPNKAKVFAGPAVNDPDDANKDVLTFDDVKIKGAQANTEYKILFWGEFTSKPSTPPNFWYKINGQNNRFVTSSGGAATNSWVQAKGLVQHPASTGSWYPITSGTLEQTINSLNYTKVFSPTHTLSQEFNDVTNNRVLRGELRFKVANTGHELRLPSGYGIKIYDSGSPGPGGECPDCTLCEEAPPRKECFKWYCIYPPISWLVKPFLSEY